MAAWDESTGQQAWKPVTRLFRNEDREVLHLEVSDETGAVETIGVTPEHPFYVPQRGWTPARELRPGDALASHANRPAAVRAVTTTPTRQTVYNFEVEGWHTYYVGNDGLVVHNMCSLKRDLETFRAAARGLSDEVIELMHNINENSKRMLNDGGEAATKYKELKRLAKEVAAQFPGKANPWKKKKR